MLDVGQASCPESITRTSVRWRRP